MPRSQDGRFNIGVKCAAPDCDRTVLFDSSYCNAHKPRGAPSSSITKPPLVPNHRKRLDGPEAKLVARKSQNVLRPGSLSRSTISSKSLKLPESSFRERSSSQQRLAEKQPADNGLKESVHKGKSTQARNLVIQDSQSTKSREISRNGPSNAQHQSNLPQHADKRREFIAVKAQHLPNGCEPTSKTPGTISSSVAFKRNPNCQNRNIEKLGPRAESHPPFPERKPSNVEPPRAKSVVEGSRGLKVHNAQKSLGTVLPTDLINKPQSFHVPGFKAINANTLRKDSKTVLSKSLESLSNPQILGKRKVDDTGSGKGFGKVTTAEAAPLRTPLARNERTIDGIEPAVSPGPSDDAIDAAEGKADGSCTSIAKSQRAGSSEEQNNDYLTRIVKLNGPEHKGSSPQLKAQIRTQTVSILPAINHERRKARLAAFDSDAFDALIYQQTRDQLPNDVSISLRLPTRANSKKRRPRTLILNPAIHGMYNRSEQWCQRKQKEIEARGSRKAWFGKPIQRLKWLEIQEIVLEEERRKAEKAGTGSFRKDPQPRTLQRPLDFGKVAEEDLPEHVHNNPAWLKFCAYMRKNEQKEAQTEAQKRAQEEKETMEQDTRRERALRSTAAETEEFYRSIMDGQRPQ